MKILYVSQSFFPSTGGVSYYLIWLSRKLREKGHDAVFVNFRTPKLPPEEQIEGFNIYRVPHTRGFPEGMVKEYTEFKELILKVFHGKNVPIDRLYNKHVYGFNGYMGVNLYFQDRVREVYQKERPDIIHVHDFQLMPLGWLLRDLRVPILFTWHIPFIDEVESGWRRFVVEYLKEYANSIFSTKAYVNSALKSGLSWSKVTCIPPFIEVEDSNIDFRKAYDISEDEKLILCVARIDRLKGQNILIEAVSKLKLKYKLVFVGNGSLSKEVLKIKDKEDYYNELQMMVSCKDLKDKVIFTGAIKRELLMAALKACDVVVLPSLQEGFGLAITEGMAFGKPVIGTSVGGIPAQIWPGVNGFLVPPEDANSLAEALEYVLSDEKRARMMGKESKKIYDELFSAERGARDHLALYKRLLGDGV
ncbi:MAG: glycosyltransferase family 4 protein [Candidatus Methanomethyliaceae archaeon]